MRGARNRGGGRHRLVRSPGIDAVGGCRRCIAGPLAERGGRCVDKRVERRCDRGVDGRGNPARCHARPPGEARPGRGRPGDRRVGSSSRPRPGARPVGRDDGVVDVLDVLDDLANARVGPGPGLGFGDRGGLHERCRVARQGTARRGRHGGSFGRAGTSPGSASFGGRTHPCGRLGRDPVGGRRAERGRPRRADDGRDRHLALDGPRGRASDPHRPDRAGGPCRPAAIAPRRAGGPAADRDARRRAGPAALLRAAPLPAVGVTHVAGRQP
ncbi:hypothetical protein CDL60_19555 [Roseateles noduli]|nr:hypothetical protein CDL60_19555 [Roseateles noduli]